MKRGNLKQTTLNFLHKRKADSDLEETIPKIPKMDFAGAARRGKGIGHGSGSTSSHRGSSHAQGRTQSSSSNASWSQGSSLGNFTYEENTASQNHDVEQRLQNNSQLDNSRKADSSRSKLTKQDTDKASSQSKNDLPKDATTFGDNCAQKSSFDKDDDENTGHASLDNLIEKNKLKQFQKKGKQIYSEPLPELSESRNHTVLFKFSHEAKQKIIYPDVKEDFVFEDHAYLPNSSKEKYDKTETPRWRKITVALKKKIQGVFELEETILFYNEHYKTIWKFDALYKYLLGMKDKNKDQFFEDVLPKIQALALKLPELFKKSVPLLKQRQSRKITMSQEQAACLLANAFFCTFPKRSFKVRGSKMPDINFSNLYCDKHAERKQQKLKCIFNYFERVTTEMPGGTLTFTRQSFSEFNLPDWENSRQLFSDLFVSDENTIEDDGKYMLQADFANKYVGGGVLGHGLVQEEIRFMLCPEMIVARLFTECLLDTEVLIMTGCERFSSYTGYSDSFKFKEEYIDVMERDTWGRRYTEVVAMDALVIKNYKEQFDKWQLHRELNKAFCAFSGKYKEEEYGRDLDLPAVCTGNWGCGAFGGDKQLKAVIQLIAAAVAKRDVCYFTFGDLELSNQLRELHQTLTKRKVPVKHIIDFIGHHKESLSGTSKTTLFQKIKSYL